MCDECFQRFEEFSKFRKNLIQHELELNRIEAEETKSFLRKFNDTKLQSTSDVRLFNCPSNVISAKSNIAKEWKVETNEFDMVSCVVIKCESPVFEQNSPAEFKDEKLADMESTEEFLSFAADESPENHSKFEPKTSMNNRKNQLKPQKTAKQVGKVKASLTQEDVKCKKCDYIAPTIILLHKHRKEYHRKLKNFNKIARTKIVSGP